MSIKRKEKRFLKNQKKIKYELNDFNLAERINLNLITYYVELGKTDLVKEYINKCLVSKDTLTQKFISIIILDLKLQEFKKREEDVEEKKLLHKYSDNALKNIDGLIDNEYKLQYYPLIAEAFLISGNGKKAIDLLNKRHDIYVKQVEEEKIDSNKQLRESHEIQLQLKELEKKVLF